MKNVFIVILGVFASIPAFSLNSNVGGIDWLDNRCVAKFCSERALFEVIDFLLENSARTKLFDVYVTTYKNEELPKDSVEIYVDEYPFTITVPSTSWGTTRHEGDTIRLESKISSNEVINRIIAYSDTTSCLYEPYFMYQTQTYTVAISPNNSLSFYKKLYTFIKKIGDEQVQSNDNIRYFIFFRDSMRRLCDFMINTYKCKNKREQNDFNIFKDEIIRYAIKYAYYVPVDFDGKLDCFHKYRSELLDQLKNNAFYSQKYWYFYKTNLIDYSVVDTTGIPKLIQDEALRLENAKRQDTDYDVYCDEHVHFVRRYISQYPDFEKQLRYMRNIFCKLIPFMSDSTSYEEALSKYYYDSFDYVLDSNLIFWSVLYVEKYNDQEFLDVLINKRAEFEERSKDAYKILDEYITKQHNRR